MALNKAKVLKSAEKYVIQGKISHAIAEYQKLIKEDPTDLPLVNTLGDLYVRIGNVSEAVKCFTRLAESYDNGGFVVRAIAMYKKVSKIDPDQIQSVSRLADLYLRQGLNSDARVHYVQVADYLIKKGELENAIAVYQRVAQIDPDTPAVDGRIAEALLKLGKKPDAGSSYLSAALKSRRKGALDEAASYLKKALEFDENDIQTQLTCAEVLSDSGQPTEALAALNRIPLHDFKPEVLETSFTIYLKAGNAGEAERVASQLVELDGQYFKLFLTLADGELAQGDLDKAAQQAGRVAELSIKHGEGKLFEARLKGILQKNPEHVASLIELVKLHTLANERHYLAPLLEKAGAIFVRSDRLAEAANIYHQLVKLEPDDLVHRENLRQVRERLGVQGDDTPLPRFVPDISTLGDRFLSEPTLQTVAPDESSDDDRGTGPDDSAQNTVQGFIVEGDLFAGYGLYQKAIDQYQRVVDAIPHHIEAHEKIRDMYAKSGDPKKAASECLVLANIFAARGDSEAANRSFALAYQYDPNLRESPISEAAPAPAAEPAEPAAKAGVPSSPLGAGSAKNLGDLLQEADFYLDLGFLSEAKASLDQYRQTGPLNAEFQQRLDRYESLLNPQASPAAGALETQAASHTSAASEASESSEEIDISGFESTSYAPVEEAGDSPAPTMAEGFESTSVAQTAQEPAKEPHPAPASESFDEMMIDLDQELVESTLEKTVGPARPVPAPPVAVASPPDPAPSALSDVFEEFKEGMEDEGDGGDYETYYNLGIAFKEMGLMEEAIGEFQKALKAVGSDVASEEFVKCCNMLGLCFVEKGLPQVAITQIMRRTGL